MGRAPCCDKMGLKKGPWTPEEDEVLVSFIQRHGHGNWRALPKLAGLMRCGKSCRLRWMNYLRPDIKRGNFSKEEEEAIISLHELLGNRWSAIAARLPGRTDNEIKNVWHTHLKKRASPGSGQSRKARPCGAAAAVALACTAHGATNSPQPSGSEVSSLATDSAEGDRYTESDDGKLFVEMDESFWQEALSALDSSVATTTTTSSAGLPAAGCLPPNHAVDGCFRVSSTSSDEDDMEFWLSVLMGIGELPELPSSSTSASSNYMPELPPVRGGG